MGDSRKINKCRRNSRAAGLSRTVKARTPLTIDGSRDSLSGDNDPRLWSLSLTPFLLYYFYFFSDSLYDLFCREKFLVLLIFLLYYIFVLFHMHRQKRRNRFVNLNEIPYEKLEKAVKVDTSNKELNNDLTWTSIHFQVRSTSNITQQKCSTYGENARFQVLRLTFNDTMFAGLELRNRSRV